MPRPPSTLFSSIAQSSSPILSLLSLGQGFAKSYSLTLLCKGFQSHQNVNFTAFTGKPVNKAVLFRSTSCWVVVFDLKTTRTPCCCWEWRSCFCKKKGKMSTIRNKDRLEYIFFLLARSSKLFEERTRSISYYKPWFWIPLASIYSVLRHLTTISLEFPSPWRRSRNGNKLAFLLETQF